MEISQELFAKDLFHVGPATDDEELLDEIASPATDDEVCRSKSAVCRSKPVKWYKVLAGSMGYRYNYLTGNALDIKLITVCLIIVIRVCRSKSAEWYKVLADDEKMKSFGFHFQRNLKQGYGVERNGPLMTKQITKLIGPRKEYPNNKTMSDYPFPKRGIVLGDAGSGKTMLFKEIINMWANDKPGLCCYDYTIFIDLRKSPKRGKFEDVLKDCLFVEDQPFEWGVIWDFLKVHQEKILILIDGYDGKYQRMEDDPFFEVFTGETLPDATVMVTSRHIRNNQFKQKAGKIFNLSGFDEDSQKKFVDDFFSESDDKGKKNVTNLLQGSSYCDEILQCPLFLTTVCIVAKESGISSVKADVFDDLCYTLVKHLCTKMKFPIEDKIPGRFLQAIKAVGGMAYSSLADGEVKMSWKEMEENLGEDMDIVLELGILKEDESGYFKPTFHCLIEYAVALWANDNPIKVKMGENEYLDGVKEILAGMNPLPVIWG